MIVLPQDPGPLLSTLPSSDFRLNDVIKVFWMGRSLPSAADLKPVLRVRKDKVLAALHFLIQYSEWYQCVGLNYVDWRTGKYFASFRTRATVWHLLGGGMRRPLPCHACAGAGFHKTQNGEEVRVTDVLEHDILAVVVKVPGSVPIGEQIHRGDIQI
jgi:hypothetical protein